MTNNSSSRKISLDILEKVFDENSFSNILLTNLVNEAQIDERQKNFIFMLVHGTVTWKIYLEYLTNKFIDYKKTPRKIQILLWMSIYQIRFMERVPDYAIVNEAVNIAKEINPKLSGLVNAVLEKFLKDKDKNLSVDVKNPEHKFCVEYAFPYKLYDHIKNDFGEEAARRVAVDSIKRPSIDFRVNTLKTSTDKLFEQYKEEFKLRKVNEVENCLTANRPVINSDIYNNGEITIQDKASILVGQTLNPAKDSRVLDMCSAPGGKLTHLAAIMQNTGEIKAYEISENRIKLIEDNIKRLGVTNVQLVNGDANEAINDEQYDYILLDAPCSGFGVLKRKPEIKLNIDWDYLDQLYKTQSELLDTAFKSLKDGGTMVYSTCTINKSENENQINKFVSRHPEIKIISEKQLFGDEMNSDGFFICKMQKN